MSLPFSSLRGNLIAAFVAVIALSLFLASAAFAYLLREYQVDSEQDRQERVAMLYTGLVYRLAVEGNSLPTIAGQLNQSASDNGARVLLLDSNGTVIHDTDSSQFVGRTFNIPPSAGHRPNVFQGRVATTAGSEIFTVVPIHGIQAS